MSDDETPLDWLRAQVEADLRMKRVLLSSKSPFTRKDAEFRVADCEAKLAILDEHGRVPDYPPESIAEHRARGWPEEQLAAMAELVYCGRCHTPVDDAREDESQCLGVIYPCRTVRLLASGYKTRPGYREEWKP